MRSRNSGLIFRLILFASEQFDDPFESSVDVLKHAAEAGQQLDDVGKSPVPPSGTLHALIVPPRTGHRKTADLATARYAVATGSPAR